MHINHKSEIRNHKCLVPTLVASNVAPLSAVGAGGCGGRAVDALHPAHLDIFGSWFGREVFVERARVRLLHVFVENAAHDDGLMAAKATADTNLIAFTDRPMRLGFDGRGSLAPRQRISLIEKR